MCTLPSVDVVAIGELLVDFVSTQAGVSVKDAPAFVKAPGGAPANVAVGVRRLGGTSAFIGKVGDDPFGNFLVETLDREGVVTSGIKRDALARTALAFVSLDDNGERSFAFFRNPSADMLLRADEINHSLISVCGVLQHGSISLIQEPSRSATLCAIRTAKESGALICYDPNLRLPLWPNDDEARKAIISAMPTADLVKIADDELLFITDTSSVSEALSVLRTAMGRPRPVVVTMGARGCLLNIGDINVEVEGFEVDAIDTTGAGDSFVSALLIGLMHAVRTCGDTSDRELPLKAIAVADWKAILTFANAAAALCTLGKGAIPSLPALQDVMRFLLERGQPLPGFLE